MAFANQITKWFTKLGNELTNELKYCVGRVSYTSLGETSPLVLS